MSDTVVVALITGLGSVIVVGIPAILVALAGFRSAQRLEATGLRTEQKIQDVHTTVARVEQDVNGNLDKVRTQLKESLAALEQYRNEHELLRDKLTAANREIVSQAAMATASAAEALKATAAVTASELLRAQATAEALRAAAKKTP